VIMMSDLLIDRSVVQVKDKMKFMRGRVACQCYQAQTRWHWETDDQSDGSLSVDCRQLRLL